MTKKLIAQGAEAKIFLDGDRIRKIRVKKDYRHVFLDEKIRVMRTRREARVLFKARRVGVNVPIVFNLNKKNESNERYELEIEFIDGDKLSDCLDGYNEEKQFDVMRMVGQEVARLHENNIVHSDLTTSNMILKENEMFIIDFGLSFISHKIEDKAVDVHLLKQALIAKHYINCDRLFDCFLEGYSYGDSVKVIERLKVVEKRGRYKH